MALADDLKNDIAAVLDDPDYGRTVTLRKVTEGTFDPATQTFSGGGTTDTTTKGLLLSYKDKEIDGTRILERDRKCILKAKGLSVIPEIGDRVVVGSDVFTIIFVKRVSLGSLGTVVHYALQVRLGG